jgi:hypothetical protein
MTTRQLQLILEEKSGRKFTQEEELALFRYETRLKNELKYSKPDELIDQEIEQLRLELNQ